MQDEVMIFEIDTWKPRYEPDVTMVAACLIKNERGITFPPRHVMKSYAVHDKERVETAIKRLKEIIEEQYKDHIVIWQSSH